MRPFDVKSISILLFALVWSQLCLPGMAAGSKAARLAACDDEALAASKAEFLRLRRIHRRDPGQVSEEEFRQASSRYIFDAEGCYQARYGAAAVGNQRIDDGGLRVNGLDASYSGAVSGEGGPRWHVLFGTKWGPGSPFAGGPDVSGPRLPGGTVSYSFMADGVVQTAETAVAGANPTGDPNTALSSLPTFDSCFYEEIASAFGAWSAVADIEFVPVSDNGASFDAIGAAGDIRIGAHAIDGPGSVLAHTYYPPPNGTSAAGDLHFDESEAWFCDPALGSIDLGIVALHELGHGIGLAHETSDTAVMEAFYNPALTFGPLADDIIGAGEIYGGSPVGKTYFFGDVGVGTDSPDASLHVQRDDGSAKILVDESSATVAKRTLFELVNNGAIAFRFRNADTGANWFFTQDSADDFSVSLSGTGGPEFRVRANGRVEMGPGANTRFDLRPNGDLTITGNVSAQSFTPLSTRTLKDSLGTADAAPILARLADLPIHFWAFKADTRRVPHIGPMAEDFHRQFGVGDDERHINLLDATGVALAAIQELRKQVQQKDEELARQAEKLEALSRRLEALESRQPR